MTTIIFPRNPLTGLGFDEEFLREVDVMRFADGIQLAHVDHDALVSADAPRFKVINGVDEGEALYRGWMLTAPQYYRLHMAVEKAGLSLFTSHDEYRTAHQIDGWLEAFDGITFPTVLLRADATDEEIREAASVLNTDKFFVKDYVKSQKGDASLSVAESLEALPATVARFIDAQDEWLVGGIVIRKFVELPADRVEIRGWWKEGEWRAFTSHPDYAGKVSTQEIPQELLDDVTNRLNGLGLRFVSVDFTPTVSEGWKVIEVGDGQVSGFPDGLADNIISSILR